MNFVHHYGKWEKRWHPLRMEWVTYAAHRNARPWSFEKKEAIQRTEEYDPKCYLCPGNTRISGVQNPKYEQIYIFENDHPVVSASAPEFGSSFNDAGHQIYKRAQAYGVAKVVCYSPYHHVTLSHMDLKQVEKVFEAWRDETAMIQKDNKIKFILIFENKGELVGVSSPHPHCQIYATDYIMPTVATQIQAMDDYYEKYNKNIFDEIIKAEKIDKIRIVAENDHAVAFIPFFARFAYEVYIFPKKQYSTLDQMPDLDLAALAEVFHIVVKKYDMNFQMSFPYIMVIHQAPVNTQRSYENYYLHINILPPLRQPGLVKYLAGPETGAGAFMADTMPEDKAAELNQIKL